MSVVRVVVWLFLYTLTLVDVTDSMCCLLQLQPFQVISAKNTLNSRRLSERKAIEEGVLDEGCLTYTDKKTCKQVLIADAIQVRRNTTLRASFSFSSLMVTSVKPI